MLSRLPVCLLALAFVVSASCGGASPGSTATPSPGRSPSAQSRASVAPAATFRPPPDPCLLISSAEIKSIFAMDLPATQPAAGECAHSGHLVAPGGRAECTCKVTVTVQRWGGDTSLVRQNLQPNADPVVPLAVGDTAFMWGTSGEACCLMLVKNHVLVDLVGVGTPLDNGFMASPPQTAFETAARLIADRI